MKPMSQLLGCVFVGAIACSLSGDRHVAVYGAEKVSQDAKAQTLPIDSIYTTGPEGALRNNYLQAAFETFGGKEVPSYSYSIDLQALLLSKGQFAPNLLLVRGDDITRAIQSTRRILVDGHTADEPPQPDPKNMLTSDKFWLAVHLGLGSVRTRWFVKSVTVQGQTIEFRY